MARVSLVNEVDVEVIEKLCQRAFYQMEYQLPPRSFIYDSDHIKAVVLRGVKSPDHILTKYELDEEIIGFMAVGLTDFNFYSVGQKTAYEIVWHGDPMLSSMMQLRVQMALLKDMLERTKGCSFFGLTLDERYLGIAHLLHRSGFTGSTRAYIRRS